MATSELTGDDKRLRVRGRERARRPVEGRRATTRAEDLAALAVGAAAGVVVGVGIVFLIAWFVA